MAELTRIYTGFAPRGRTSPAGRPIVFERGVPVEVTAEEAALLDATAEWAEPESDKPKPQASTAKNKES